MESLLTDLKRKFDDQPMSCPPTPDAEEEEEMREEAEAKRREEQTAFSEGTLAEQEEALYAIGAAIAPHCKVEVAEFLVEPSTPPDGGEGGTADGVEDEDHGGGFLPEEEDAVQVRSLGSVSRGCSSSCRAREVAATWTTADAPLLSSSPHRQLALSIE